MAAVADWLAFGRHTALAAISPALVFFVWTSTLGTDDTQVLLTVGVLRRRRCVRARAEPGAARPAAQLAGVAARRRARTGWRRRRCSGAPPSSWRSWSRRSCPAADADPLLDVASTGRNGSGGHSYQPAIAPFFDIGDKLDDVDDVDLFTVQSSKPDYWRIAALDSYSSDGGGRGR